MEVLEEAIVEQAEWQLMSPADADQMMTDYYRRLTVLRSKNRRRNLRGYLKIKGDILAYLDRVGVASTKYSLVTRCNLNYDLLYAAIKDLISLGLVEWRQALRVHGAEFRPHHFRSGKSKDVFTITDKGIRVVRLAAELNALLTPPKALQMMAVELTP